jgi:hypothetical protein
LSHYIFNKNTVNHKLNYINIMPWARNVLFSIALDYALHRFNQNFLLPVVNNHRNKLDKIKHNNTPIQFK